jgi:hypothetical protein
MTLAEALQLAKARRFAPSVRRAGRVDVVGVRTLDGMKAATTPATTRPATAIQQTAARHATKVSSSESNAGMAAFPRSPLKLYVPRAARAPPDAYARETADEPMGCCTLAPAPETARAMESPTRLPVVPAKM